MPLPLTKRLRRGAAWAIVAAGLGTIPADAAEADGQTPAIRILVQSSPLAGAQYHALPALWPQIRPGDRLTLTRERDNRHDRYAVRVDWNGQPLGYLPRRENRAVAQALDAGAPLEARVARLRDDPDPWRRVLLDVYLKL